MEKHADHGSNWSAHFLQQKGHMKPVNITDLIPKIDSTIAICVTLIFLSAIVGLGYYGVNDRKLMAENINTAISKGIDPLSVRCSYAKSDDIICVAFASSAQSHNTSVSIKK
jgi:hypothetical protein